MSDYVFSPLAVLLGAHCRKLSFHADGVVFTTKQRQQYHYPWSGFDPHIRHFRGTFFDTLILTWQQQRIRLNGIAKGEVQALIDDLYNSALSHQQAYFIDHYQQLTQVLAQGYIAHSQWCQLQNQLAPLEPWLLVQPQLNKIPPALQQPLARLRYWQQSGADSLTRYNQAFIDNQKQCYQRLFDELENQPLTEQQRDACIISDDANLVLAGAGCGKTSVMLGRCAYLLASERAQAAEIIILAFAKDAAQEMQARLQLRLPQAQIKVKTFHGLGLDIIAAVEGRRPVIAKLSTSESAQRTFFQQQLTALLTEPEFQQLFSDYCYAHLVWQARVPAHKHEAEVSRLLVGKGSYKALLAQLIALTLSYKNLASGMLAAQLDELPENHLAVLTAAVITPLLAAYRQQLEALQQIDFDDMITTASAYVRAGRFISPWQHLLVDEFQDISQARATLVHELHAQREGAKLFCVGDDWQAIYQFAGSDIRVTSRFANYFGATKTVALATTFRFNDQISAVASRFVMRNPNQLDKQMTTLQRAKKPCVHISYYQASSSKTTSSKAATGKQQQAALLSAVATQLAKISKVSSPVSVLLLARFNFQLPDKSTLADWTTAYPSLTIKAMTVHAAKGQEADQVLILAMQAGEHGFPSNKPCHPLSIILQPDNEAFPDAEERRLFYVALTRARQQVYLLCDSDNPSPFITELCADDYPITVAKHTKSSFS